VVQEETTEIEETVTPESVSTGGERETETAGERDLAGELVERGREEGVELVRPDGLRRDG
jgi:hypothetical protein